MNKQTIIGLIIGLIIGGGSIQAINIIDKPDDKKTDTKTTTAPSTTAHNDMMTANLKDLKGDDFDKAFMEEMIMHHQGAIDMAKLIESNGKHEELKVLGKDILSAQSKEIDMMQTWQADWGYKVVPRSHGSHGM